MCTSTIVGLWIGANHMKHSIIERPSCCWVWPLTYYCWYHFTTALGYKRVFLILFPTKTQSKILVACCRSLTEIIDTAHHFFWSHKLPRFNNYGCTQIWSSVFRLPQYPNCCYRKDANQSVVYVPWIANQRTGFIHIRALWCIFSSSLLTMLCIL